MPPAHENVRQAVQIIELCKNLFGHFTLVNFITLHHQKCFSALSESELHSIKNVLVFKYS